MKAYAYYRTNTSSDFMKQVEKVEAAAQRIGIELAETFTDLRVSGLSEVASRSGMKQLLEALRVTGKACLVVSSLSRISRDGESLSSFFRFLRDHDVELVVADTPDLRFEVDKATLTQLIDHTLNQRGIAMTD